MLLLLAAAVSGFRAPSGATRRSVLSGACAAASLSLFPTQQAAADGKYDKKFEACVSQCLYEQTKITKGVAKVEVMSRAEAYAVCKPKCATSKEQLLIGQPKKPSS